jgi:hypothetical protein
MITLADWQRQAADASEREAANRAARRDGEWVEICAALARCAALSEAVCRQQAVKQLLNGWTQTQLGLMRASLQDQIALVRERLTQSVSAALADLLSEGIKRRAIEDFCVALKQLAGEELREGLAIRLPEDLRPAAEQRLLAHGLSARVILDDGPEISTQISGTRIKTSISAWTQELLGCIADVHG